MPEVWRQAIEFQIDVLGARITELETRCDVYEMKIGSIDANTREVVEILRDWKGAMKVLKFTAKIIAPLGVIATAATAIVTLLKMSGFL